MQNLPDLSPNTEMALYVATLLAFALLMARGSLAYCRHRMAVQHRYPAEWSDAHITILEHLRISIGFVLVLTWGFLLVAAPRMPSSAPFGVQPALLLIFLLLLTNAWVRLMIPSEWKDTFGKMKSKHAVAGLFVVWSILLGGQLFAIAKSATSTAERPVYIFGTYA
jgi:hypothetical protein